MNFNILILVLLISFLISLSDIFSVIYSKVSSSVINNSTSSLSLSNENPTFELGNLFIIFIIYSTLTALSFVPKIEEFNDRYGIKRDPRYLGIPKSIRYVNVSNKQDLIPVIQNVSNSLKTILTIYGILISFVIATQLQLASSSFTFTIWVSLILSIIIRGWYFEHSLSDSWLVKDLEDTKSLLVSAHLFSKRSAYLFALVLSVTPAFFFVDNSMTNVENQWEGGLSVFFISMGIIVFTLLSYQMIFGFGKRSSGGTGLVFMSLAFLSLSILGLYFSPLQPIHISLFTIYETKIPSVLLAMYFPSMILIFPYGMIKVVLPIGNYLYARLRNKNDLPV